MNRSDAFVQRFYVLLLVTLILILGSISACSEKKNIDPVIKKTPQMVDQIKSNVKSQIELLCLKYDIQSDNLKNDILQMILSADTTIKLLEGKDVTGKIMSDLFRTSVNDEIKTLTELSRKHDSSIRILASLYYDYLIWKKLEDIESSKDNG